MDDSKPKYLNSPESPIFNKRRLLFAIYQALPAIKAKKQAIMVEGYMDAISLHAHGVTNAVASLGTAFTIEQARLLKNMQMKWFSVTIWMQPGRMLRSGPWKSRVP